MEGKQYKEPIDKFSICLNRKEDTSLLYKENLLFFVDSRGAPLRSVTWMLYITFQG